MKFAWGMCVALLVAGAALSAETVAAETLRYVVLVDNGTQAGHQWVTHGDDGVTRVEYYFKDNGRGPELEEEFTLASDGTFKTYRLKGVLTYGALADESFSRDGNRATWKSTSDAGTQAVSGSAQYSPLGGSFEQTSVAIAALAKRADGKLPLIPGGTMTMRKVAEADVARDDEKRKLQLLALSGVGLAPRFVWATTGPAPRLFAAINPGAMQLIEEGWQANAAALEAQQVQAEAEVLRELATRLRTPLPGTTLIRNARVFDSEHARLGDASDVVIRNGRIESINALDPASADQLRTVQTAALVPDHVIDAGGRVLLPGLFDMHGHIGRWEGALHLAAGITTLRDMGNDNAMLQALMAEEQAGQLLAPAVVPAGFIEGESPMSSRSGFVIRDLEEAKQAIDWYAGHGYPQIKIYNSFPKRHLRATAAYAHEKGLRVSGHVPAFMRAQDVVEQGYDEIQHINQVMLNFLVDDKTDTRTLQRFTLVADKTDGLDFDSKPVQDFIALLASKQIVVDPTLATFEFLHQRDGELSPIVAAVAGHLPPDIQRGRRAAEMHIPDDVTAARYNGSFAKLVEFVGRMYKAGVPIVAGTDELAGFTLQRELELYVQAGMTPSQALQVATWNGAKYSRVLDDRGSITPGKRADLVLVDGEPTANIADIRKVALVIKGDTAYYPGEIHEALGIKPFTEPVRLNSAH